MVRYLSLLSYTSRGVDKVKDSTKRAKQFRTTVEDAGGRIISLYWSVGEFDGAVVFEAPDEQTAAALLLKLAQQGNVRTRSLRVYDEPEFADILGAI